MNVVDTVQSCGSTAQGQATAEQLRRAGLSPGPLARAVAVGDVHRLSRRVYGLVPLPPRPQYVVTDRGTAPAYVAHVRAALLSLGKTAVAHGRTAAALRGWPMLVEPSRTVDVAVPHGSRRVALAHVKISERRCLPAEDVEVLLGTDVLRVATAVQTVLDCCRTLPLLEAVVICDSALRAGDVTVAELQRAAACLRGLREAARARRVLELCDPDCGSVLESVLRFRMMLDGVSGFATQLVLQDGLGRHVHRADFAFEHARLIVEVDGQKWHQDVERDRRRDNQLAALGWRVLRYRWAEVVHGSDAVLQEIRRALGVWTEDCQFAPVDLAVAA
jgi:very-short-patch-repair endonuclease